MAGRDKMTHHKNKHDDRVRAAAQSHSLMVTYDYLSARAQRRYQQPSKKKHYRNKGKCMGQRFLWENGEIRGRGIMGIIKWFNDKWNKPRRAKGKADTTR